MSSRKGISTIVIVVLILALCLILLASLASQSLLLIERNRSTTDSVIAGYASESYLNDLLSQILNYNTYPPGTTTLPPLPDGTVITIIITSGNPQDITITATRAGATSTVHATRTTTTAGINDLEAVLALDCTGSMSSPSVEPFTIQAESGTLSNGMTANVSYISQSFTNLTTPSANGLATYTFNIGYAGYYKITASVNNLGDGASNSFFINIDSDPGSTMIWDVDPLVSGLQTKDINWRGTGTEAAPQYPVKTFNLTTGPHTLYLRGREANTRLDSFQIVPTFTPPTRLEAEGDAAAGFVQSLIDIKNAHPPGTVTINLGVQVFGTDAAWLVTPTTDLQGILTNYVNPTNFKTSRNSSPGCVSGTPVVINGTTIYTQIVMDGTSPGSPFAVANAYFAIPGHIPANSKPVEILITDGEPTSYGQYNECGANSLCPNTTDERTAYCNNPPHNWTCDSSPACTTQSTRVTTATNSLGCELDLSKTKSIDTYIITVGVTPNTNFLTATSKATGYYQQQDASQLSTALASILSEITSSFSTINISHGSP